MATNRVQAGDHLNLPVTAGKKSGDWDMVGDMPVVLLTDADSNDMADCDTGGVYTFSVKGVSDAGNSAVTIGDRIYADGDELNEDAANGKDFGYALGAVTGGTTVEIPVKIGR